MQANEIRDVETRLDAAIARLQKLAANNSPFGGRQGAETEYANSYQQLVRLGARPQLRAKYRAR